MKTTAPAILSLILALGPVLITTIAGLQEQGLITAAAAGILLIVVNAVVRISDILAEQQTESEILESPERVRIGATAESTEIVAPKSKKQWATKFLIG